MTANETEITEANLNKDHNGSHTMDEPEYNARSIDADLLLGVAECGIFGNPVIVVIGEAEGERATYPELQENSGLSSLGTVDRVEFLASAIAGLQVKLDEIKKPGK